MTQVKDWLWRFVKGMFIGSGFILPGVSGGALAAIFGLYEDIIRFLANLTKNFWKNVKFFLPVGLGGLFGIVILARGLSHLLTNYETIIVWFFVGAIIGMLPALWKEAGQKGRNKKDISVMITSFIFGFIILFFGAQIFGGNLSPSFGAWILSGFLIALGVLVPGLSPSNFILYLGLYQAMAEGFSQLDLSVIIPIGIGGLLTVLLLSKIIERIFDQFYSEFFHFIFGIVAASTIMIIPTNYSGFGLSEYIWCFVMLLGGTALGWWMAQLEEKYK